MDEGKEAREAVEADEAELRGIDEAMRASNIEVEAATAALATQKAERTKVTEAKAKAKAKSARRDAKAEYESKVFSPPLDPKWVGIRTHLTQREYVARKNLDTVNADPEAILHGNYKLREIFKTPHPPDLHVGPDTQLRREVLGSMLREFRTPLQGLTPEAMDKLGKKIRQVLTSEERDARTTLSKARANPQLVESSNLKILEFNDKVVSRLISPYR